MQRAFDGVAFDFNKIGFDTPEENIHYVSAPYIYRRPAGMTVEDFCDHLVQEFEDKVEEMGPERIAAFFAEPIMGMGGSPKSANATES